VIRGGSARACATFAGMLLRISILVVMTLWVGPMIAWAVHETVISFRDALGVLSRPLASISVGGCLAFALRLFCGGMSSSLLRLVLEGRRSSLRTPRLIIHSEQRSFYLDLLRGFNRSPSVEQKGSYAPTM
jgi:hypothetical protein